MTFCLFKGDIINVIRQVDENWCEGKLGGKLGIFPITFVEVRFEMSFVINKDEVKSSEFFIRSTKTPCHFMQHKLGKALVEWPLRGMYWSLNPLEWLASNFS